MTYQQAEIESLFDLEADVGESRNVAAQHPDVVEQLTALVEHSRENLGDSLTCRKGKHVPQAGKLSPAN